jgi:uncharacterized protein (TIGR02284 family)
MVTTVGTESELVDLLIDLIKLDYDAIEAYNSAIQKLKNSSFADQMRVFRDDHERHTKNLRPFVSELGKHAPTNGDMKSLLTTGKVAMGALMGDKAILMAMKTNEDDTNTAYERATKHAGMTSELKNILSSNLADERRHRTWIEQTMKKL